MPIENPPPPTNLRTPFESDSKEEYWFNAVCEDPLCIRNAAPHFRADPAIMRAAALIDVEALKYADRDLKKNKEFMHEMIVKNGDAFVYADDELKTEYDFALTAVQLNPLALKHVDIKRRKHFENFLLDVILHFKSVQPLISAEIELDEDLILSALERAPEVFNSLPEDFKNKNFILEAIEKNHAVFPFIAALRDEKAFVYNGMNFSAEFQQIPLFLEKAAGRNGLILQFLKNEFKDHEGIVGAAVDNKGEAIQFASDRLRKNVAMAQRAVRQTDAAYYHIGINCQNDRSVGMYLRDHQQRRGA